MLLCHQNKWCKRTREEKSNKKKHNKRKTIHQTYPNCFCVKLVDVKMGSEFD